MKKIVFIILAWILVIEGTLHLTSLGVRYWMMPKTKANLSTHSQIKILCIGESTTVWGGEDAYPGFLQRKLKSRFGDKYQVINKGLPGANTHKVLSELPRYLDDVQPQIVVVMTGINDYWATIDKDAPLWQRSLEFMSRYLMLAKLTRNILVNIEYGKKTDIEMSKAADCGGHNSEIGKFVKEAELIKKSGDIKKTVEYLEQKISLLTPNGDCSIGDPLYWMLISLQEHELNNKELALQTVEKVLSSYMVPYKRSEFLVKRNLLRSNLGMSSNKIPDIRAENYWENSTYKVNIQQIIAQMQSRSIPVIMMQYPRLSVGPLKDILLDHRGVTFVENKIKFEEALKTMKSEDLFYDHFAGIFGHFKPVGAELVADEVLSAILKMETQD